MKYFEIAENSHFYDFVFYECEKKTMYIYCPNCDREHEVVITKEHNVKWLKENYQPCDCFRFRGKQPSYKHSRYSHENLNRVILLGEFVKLENGDVALNVYWHKAEFGVSNYDCCDGYAFKRKPIFTDTKVIEFLFKADNSVSMATNLYIPMCRYTIKIGHWNVAKKWHKTFLFDLITESLEELKNTFLEKYIPDIDKMAKYISNKKNIQYSPDEFIAAFLILLITKKGVFKLWKAGYKELVFNKTLELINPNNSYYGGQDFIRSGCILNYSGKTLESILRMEPQKLNLVAARADITVELLSAAQKLTTLPNVEMNRQNINIVQAYRFESLSHCFEESNIPISKLFKFLRHEIRKVNRSVNSVVNDYFDYIDMLQKLHTPLTKDVLFPSNFTRSHDNTVAKYQESKNKHKNKDFALSIRKYKDFSFSDGRFKIDLISSIKQLLKEANKFHNCSAGYIDRIIQGSSVLFLIREIEHPRKNVWMLEYNPEQKRIIQNRGIRNVEAPDKVREFAKSWLMNSNINRA